MTVEGTTIIASRGYVATAGQTVFGFPLKVPSPPDLAVFVDEVRKALGADYSVLGTGSAAGCTVTFLTPMAGGEYVLLQLDLPYTQPTDYLAGSLFQAEQHEEALDRQVLLSRQLLDRSWRAPTFSPFAPPSHLNVELPDMVPGAVLRVNGSGDGLTWSPVQVDDLPPVVGMNAQDVAYDAGTNVDAELDANRTKNTAQDSTLSAHGSAITAVTNQSNSNASSIVVLQNRFAKRPCVTDPPWNAKGDGVTDDAPAFKACRDATNGRFHIPSGNYLLLSPIVFSPGQGCDISGDGNNASLLTYRGNDHCIVVDNGYIPWSVKDLGFGHDRTTGTPTGGAALAMYRAAGGMVSNLQIFAPYAGLYMEPPNANGAPNNHFEDITIGYHEFAGVALMGTLGVCGGYFRNIVINGGAEPGASTYGPGVAWLLRDHVEGLQVQGGDLIYCQYAVDARSVNYGFGDRVEYNTFDYAQFDSCLNGVFLYHCALMRFNNCWCASHVSSGYVIEDSVAIEIGGGIIYNCAGHGVHIKNNASVVRVHDVTISSNSAGNTNIYSGVHADAGASDFMVVNNFCGSTPLLPTANTQKYGIEVATGGSDRYLIEGNLVRGNVTAGVFDGGAGTNKSVARNF